MKAAKATLAKALERPDSAIRFYLFHGPDESGSRALAIQLLKGLGDAEKFIVLGQAVKSARWPYSAENGRSGLNRRAMKLPKGLQRCSTLRLAKARSLRWQARCARLPRC